MKSATTQMLEGAAGGHADPGDGSVSGGKRKRVLLVEDEPATRLVLLQKLRLAGFDVDVAVNGKIALEKIRTGHPDVIFMDLMLPRVKGVDVIKAARSDPEFANRPIYVCTSAALMRVWTRRGTKAGATKVFNRASTPIDAIVAQVAAEVLGCGTTVAAPRTTMPDNTLSEELPAIPVNREMDVAGAGGIQQPPRQINNEESSAAPATARSMNFMKRIVKSLGLDWASGPSSGSGAAAPPESIQPAPEATVPEPAADSNQEEISATAGAPALEQDYHSGNAEAGQLEGINGPATDLGVAVLTLDESAKILSANKTCTGMFGWEGPALVGQNLKLLLKDGLEDDISKLLQRQRSGDQSKVTCPLLTVARRKDGTEFPVSITTLTWSSDTTMMRKSDVTLFCWTAFIRDMAGGANLQGQQATLLGQGGQVPNEQSMSLAADVVQLQEHYTTLQQANEELQKQLQQVSTEAAMRHDELTKREQEREDLARRIFDSQVELNQARTELEREAEERRQLEQKVQELTSAKTEIESQLAAQSQSEQDLLNYSGEFRQQLDEAKAAADRAEAACQQEIARAKQFEEDLAHLRREYEELNQQLVSEKEAAAETSRRTEEMETRLRDSAAEVERVRLELEQQTAEQTRLESEWREQLKSAEALTKKLEAGWLEEVGRNKGIEERLQIYGNSLRLEQAERSRRFEEEVVGLRQERDELYGMLTAEQHATAEFKRRTEELEGRLHAGAAEAERVKAELDKQTEEQRRLESEWREKLSTAEALTQKLEAAWVEAVERNNRSEVELAGLRKVRDDLNGKLAGEQQAAAASGRRNDELAARVIENAVELERIRTELQKAGRDEQFEARLNGLEQVRDELSGELKSEQQATAESRQRTEELENRLRENAAELERVKAEADKHAEEQARLESELQTQLNQANSAAEQAEAALKEKVAQCSQFEKELAGLERVRDELGGKLATEQQAAAESRRRGEELEARLRESAAELERLKADREKQAEEQARLESELRSQLDAAKAAAEQAEAALNEQTAQNRGFEERLRLFGNSLRMQQIESAERFENELTSLQQVRDVLGGKLTAEQEASAESRKRSEELENRLRENTRELERIQSELERQAEERAHLESKHRAQIDEGKTATEKAEAARHEEAERSKRLEEEMAVLRRERDELNHKFSAEQKVVTESRQHGEELDRRLHETAAELARVQVDLARHAEERAHFSAEKAATEKAETARAEEADRRKRLEEEMAGLRRERDELNTKFKAEQQAVAEARRHSEGHENRLRETTGELERIRTELARHAEERNHIESGQRTQLAAAQAAVAQAEATLTQKSTLCQRLQEEASSLWQESEALSAKLGAEQQAAVEFKRRSEELEGRLRENAAELEEVKTSRTQQAEEQKRLEAEWREQLLKAQTSGARAEESLKEAVAKQRQLERSLVNLRNERHQVYDRFRAEHQAGEKSKRRIGELEKRLRERATELQQARSELEKQVAERSRLDCDLRAQLESARATAERELGSLRQEREELSGRLASEQQAAAVFRRRSEEFDARLRENAAELERVKVELDQHAQERARLESEHRNLTDTKDALGQELRHLRENEAIHKSEIAGMEGRLAEGMALLARAMSDLETERGERHRLEQRAASLAVESQKLHEELRQHLESEQSNEKRIAGLMHQLREREDTVTKVGMELQKEMLDRQTAEEQLRATADMSSQLRDHLCLIEEAKKVFESRQTDLESRLQASLNALRESESSMEKETGERRRLEEALQAAQRESQRQNESNAIELSKLQSAVQIEQLGRKGLEAQAIQSRYSSLDSSRVGAAMVNNFRNRIRQPIDRLMESARRLLEIQMADEPKKLVESLLENALLLQTSVRESGTSDNAPVGEGGENQRPSDALRPLDLIPNQANGGLQP